MAKRKKKRTSIRTAAGTAQDLFLGRIRSLADDPLRALPAMPHGTPKPLAKVQAGLEKLAQGKAGFTTKRDRGIVGAVWQSMQLAQLESVPRLVDHKVGGRRRFYLMRGQVHRACMLGVQNHDDPQVLLMAYRKMAKESSLHFFADTGVTCSGDQPHVPDSWWTFIADKLGIEWQQHRCRTCAHPERGLVEVGFAGGESMAVCHACAKDVGNLHRLVASYYAGPRERTPLEIWVLPDGIDGPRNEPERELAAGYRAGVETEASLLSQS
ncbi:MAG: hypothetical protein ACPHID_00155 [Thermoplasmatota archaeon]